MDYLERTISYLTKNVRGHDAKAFTRSPAFASFPEPTIAVTSPDCGPTGAILDKDHTQDGKDLIPTISWTLPPSIPASSVREYLLVIQDLDVPIPTPVMHAAYYAIPASVTTIGPEDLKATPTEQVSNLLKGGFRYAKNLRSTIYSGPRPLKGHGQHRYSFQVVALKEPLDLKKMSPIAKKEDLLREVQGKIVGWGVWIGVAERN